MIKVKTEDGVACVSKTSRLPQEDFDIAVRGHDGQYIVINFEKESNERRAGPSHPAR